MTAPSVVVVDPFGSGKQLGAHLHAAGWRVIAVISTADHPDWVRSSLRENDFAVVLDADVAPGSLRAELAGQDVRAVMAGWETGVELADRLAAWLGVPGNSPSRSVCRRHKGAMADRLRAAGVRSADHLATGDPATLAAWVRARDTWPIVVKPAASGGSDSINVCRSMADVTAAFTSIIGQVNVLGDTNRELIAQEFLHGQQYLVNTASTDGTHYVGEIWRFDSFYEEGTQIYDKQELLEPYGDPQDVLVDYTLQVLRALDIRHGPAHTEIMLTERGPVLIECAARMTGGICRPAVQAATGHDHVTLTAESYLAPDRLLARAPRYTLRRRLGIVALRSPAPGRLAGGRALDDLMCLPTLAGSTKPLAAGTEVARTHSFVTSPGLLYLVADSMDEIRRDTERVRRIESSGEFYLART